MKSNIFSSTFGVAFSLIFFILGLVQLFAIYSCFYSWFGGYSILAVICGIIVSGMPIISTVLGIYGAVTILDWNLLLAILLFAPMLVLYIPMMFGVGIGVILIKIKEFLRKFTLDSANTSAEILEEWKRSETNRNIVELWEKESNDSDFIHTGDIIIDNGQFITKTYPCCKTTTLDRLNARKLSVLDTKEVIIYHDKEEETEFKWIQNGTVLELWEKGIHDTDFVNTGEIKTDRKASFSFSMGKSKDTTIKRLSQKMTELGLN